MITLGIDTSNYTTSCALYDSSTGNIIQCKKLLPVKEGEKGIRQSYAVFHHTAQLSPLLKELLDKSYVNIDAVGASDKPRTVEGSYMPCFTVGYNTAVSIGAVIKKPVYTFSHQDGHIAAAIYSSGRFELLKSEFIAFHISGGTTECLLVKPDKEKVFSVEIICSTDDINCGQAIDRCGVLLGLNFPCGAELEGTAMLSEKTYSPKISVKDGNCNLSGLENQCIKMLSEGESKPDIAKYCLSFVGKTIKAMTDYAVSRYGSLPLLFAGGVMSDRFIRTFIDKDYNAFYAQPEFSCDNAAGIAYLTYLKETEKNAE